MCGALPCALENYPRVAAAHLWRPPVISDTYLTTSASMPDPGRELNMEAYSFRRSSACAAATPRCWKERCKEGGGGGRCVTAPAFLLQAAARPLTRLLVVGCSG